MEAPVHRCGHVIPFLPACRLLRHRYRYRHRQDLQQLRLLHALRQRGRSAVGMKPVASGCEQTAQGLRNEDAIALLAASDPAPAYADLNPYALPLPLARSWPPPRPG